MLAESVDDLPIDAPLILLSAFPKIIPQVGRQPQPELAVFLQFEFLS